MSTRATYLFKANEQHDDICFYIHHDGYEEGAATYMNKARVAWTVGAESFFRNNEGAKLTKCHQAHSDTQYRYTFIDKKTVVVEKGRSLSEIFNGTIKEFIELHLGS